MIARLTHAFYNLVIRYLNVTLSHNNQYIFYCDNFSNIYLSSNEGSYMVNPLSFV